MKLFNTMTMQKEEFVPIEAGKVRMYACGPTVYNFIHVGNARPIIMFDVLRRYLEYRGYDVTFVQNFTDVDDKIIRRANEEGISASDVAEKYIAEYWTDVKALGVREATVHPRATENMQQIIDMVTKVFTSIVRSSRTVLGLLAWLLYLNWVLTLVTLVHQWLLKRSYHVAR